MILPSIQPRKTPVGVAPLAPFPRLGIARLRPLLFVLVAGLATAAEPATPAIPALEQKLAAAPPADRPALLTELAERLEAFDPLRGIALAQEAITTAATPRTKLSATAVLAGLRRQQTDYAEAMRLSQAGLADASKIGDDRLRARFLYLIARTHWSLADDPASIASFHEAIFLGEKTGDIALLCDAHTGIVTVYTELKDYPRSEFHLAQAEKYAQQLGDLRRLGDYYKVLGNHRGNSGDPVGARAAHTRSLETHRRAGNERGVADALLNLGSIVENEGDLPGARERYNGAIAIYEQQGLKRNLANATRLLGGVLVKEHRFAEGFVQLERSLTLAREFGGGVTLASVYSQLAVAHEAAGNLPLALKFQRRLQTATASIFTEKARQQVVLLNAQFESERRLHEIADLHRDQSLRAAELRARDAELERARAVRTALIAGALIIVAALAAILAAQRARLRAERRALGETRRAQMLAEDAGVLKSRLLAIASHDLKGPLRSMLRSADTIEQKSADPAAVSSAARLLRGNARQMSDLVRDLLDLAAIEGGDLQLHRSPLDLGQLAAEIVSRHAARAEEKLQTLSFAPPAAPLPFVGDPARLAQAIDNLIDNAVKYTPAGGTIRVTAERRADHLCVAVADEGPGLGPDDLARMFQPFQRLSAQPTGGEASTGLGLHITRDFIARHGGSVEVDSAPGQGTTFTALLPVPPT